MQFVREAGIFAWIHLAVALGGVLWAVVAAGLLGMRWRVPPLLALAPLFATALTVWASAMYASLDLSSLAVVDPAQRTRIYASVISATLSNGVLSLAAVPAAAVLGLGGLVAGVRGPRRWGPPALAFFSCILVALLPLATLQYGGDFFSVMGRLLLYGLFAAPVAASLLSSHTDSNGREASIVTGGAWLSLVAACEVATVSSAWSDGFSALASVDPGSRAARVAALVEEVGRQGLVGWVLVLAAAVPMVLALVRSASELTEEELLTASVNPSPMRFLGQAIALALILTWGLSFWATDPAALLLAIAK